MSGNKIGGWLKTSFIDFPGTVSTVLFFNGCNMNCPYCHNYLLASGKSKENYDFNEILDYLNKRKNLIDGVVFSGGEATLVSDIVAMAIEIKKRGFKLKLDTNGLHPEVIKEISPHYLALDIKTSLEKYKEIILGKYDDYKERLLESIEIAKSMGNNSEIRITLSPKLITSSDIEKIIEYSYGIKQVYLQRINLKQGVMDNNYFTDTELISDNQIEEFKMQFEAAGISCSIR